jgi:hypothetical protein
VNLKHNQKGVVSTLLNICQNNRMASREKLVDLAMAHPELCAVTFVGSLSFDSDFVDENTVTDALQSFARGAFFLTTCKGDDGERCGWAVKSGYGSVIFSDTSSSGQTASETVVQSLLRGEIEYTLALDCLAAKTEVNQSVIERCNWQVGGKVKNPVIGVRKYSSGLIKDITPDGEIVIELVQRGKRDRTLAQIPAVVLQGQPIVMR